MGVIGQLHGETACGTDCVGGWVGSRAGLDIAKNRTLIPRLFSP
jgi:hypothetical protein